METLTQVAQALQYVLTDVADRLGRETGFIQRKRKLTGARFVQALVFGWLAQANSSMEGLSQSAANVGVDISRQGIEDRFNAVAAAFLKRMVEACVECVLRANQRSLSVLQQFNGVYLEDSTVIRLPDALSQLWAGCQHSALKLSVRWELQRGGLEALHLHAGREHDQQAPLHTAPVPAGGLQLRDLGYFDLEVMQAQAAQGSYWLMRYKMGTSLFDASGKRLSVSALLKQAVGGRIDCAIQLGQQQRLSGRLVAETVDDQTLRQRQQRLRQWERKHQSKASAEKWQWLGWSLYVTNLPQACLSTEQVLDVAHLRWQIELLFKLWKSELQVDEWRSQNPWRILCEVYAKLIAVMVQHWLMLLGDGHDLQRSLVQMSRTIQKKAWHLAAVLSDGEALCKALLDLQRCFLKGCRISFSASSPPTFQRFVP